MSVDDSQTAVWEECWLTTALKSVAMVGSRVPRDDYESERTADRAESAAVLSGLADGLLDGMIHVGEGADAVTVAPPDELSLEVELETEDDEVSLEVELEWPLAAEGEVEPDAEAVPDSGAESEEIPDVPETPVRAATGTESLARFEVYRDKGDEWRWRLRHRNGNIIATSGEGYTRKHNAQKGLRSVVANAPGAEVRDGESD